MSTETNFKELWNKQEMTDIPDPNELIAKAYQLKTRTRDKLIMKNLAMLVTLVIILMVAFNIDNEHMTTKIGVVLIVIGILSYMWVYNGLIPLLLKTHINSSSHEYLNQLIAIKRRNDFLNKVMINIYFGLLSIGMFLYMLQFAMRMSPAWAAFYYIITFAWIGFAWFYLRPRGVKRKAKALNEMIEKLEAMNKQLSEQ